MDAQNTEQIRLNFQRRWPLDTLKKMTLKEYNSIKEVSGNNTFCHWIEQYADPLGRIKGFDAYKFGIYHRSPWKPHSEKRSTSSDGEYSFKNCYGTDQESAFNTIRDLLIKTVIYAQNEDFSQIDAINLDNRLKWKTAFIYAKLNTLVPIYKEDKLQAIALALGGKDIVSSGSFARMNEFIASKRPLDMSIYEYSYWLYHRLDEYINKREEVQYYIVGSKYGENNDEDVFPLMKKKGVISTDYGPAISLSDYYGNNNKEDLIEYLEEYGGENSTALKQLHCFLNIRLGDMIAIKKRSYPHNGHGALEIHCLAIVVEVDGQIYSYDHDLGHCLNVQFIPYEGEQVLNIGGYREAVIHVVNQEYRNAIFGQCAVNSPQDLVSVISGPLRRAIEELNTHTSIRRAIKECVINRRHNKLQEAFAKYLKSKYGENKVFLEENFVDIRVVEDDALTFFEVKKDYRPVKCIREALGQLMEYSYQHQGEKPIRFVVVGPSLASSEDEQFIRFLKQSIKQEFDYIGFPGT